MSEWIAVAYFAGTALVALIEGIRRQGSGISRRQAAGGRDQRASGVKGQGSGIGKQETGNSIQDSGFAIRNSGIRIQDSGISVQDSGFGIQDSPFRGQGQRPRVGDVRKPLAVAGLAVVAASLVIALAAAGDDTWWLTIARDWAPAAYLMFGYWLPGGLQHPPNPRLEAWLTRADRRLFAWLGSTLDSPFWRGGLLEAVYLLVYPFVPACFLLLYSTDSSEVCDAFWSAVLVSGYACYGTLPWLAARPPRQIDAQEGLGTPHTRQAASGSRVHRLFRRLNERVSGSMGVGGDTVPSGHVAVAVAAALVAAESLPITGTLLVLLALVIAAATVAGRYHYLVDALGGLAVGALAWFVLTWIRS